MNQTNQQPSGQRQESPEEKAAREAIKRMETTITPENVIVLLAGDEISNKRLRPAVAAKYPKAQCLERVPTARLSNVNAVIACVPVQTTTFDEDGNAKTNSNNAPRFTVPVFVADHWKEGISGDKFVNLSTFLQAFGAPCLPYQANSRALTEGYLHLKDV